MLIELHKRNFTREKKKERKISLVAIKGENKLRTNNSINVIDVNVRVGFETNLKFFADSEAQFEVQKYYLKRFSWEPKKKINKHKIIVRCQAESNEIPCVRVKGFHFFVFLFSYEILRFSFVFSRNHEHKRLFCCCWRVFKHQQQQQKSNWRLILMINYALIK
jgi:hypothetical protein